MALVAAALGIATTIAVPLLPRTWAWTRDALAVWGIVGVLLILAIVLAAIAALRDGPDDVLTLTGVADELAVAVRNQWQAEAATRRLNDPPLQVSWGAADPSLTNSWDELITLATTGAGWPEPPSAGTWADSPEDLAGAGAELATVLARVPTGRLVVLGNPGAGKTLLMVRLVLDLLVRRAADGPVPVLVPLASWNPDEQKLSSWLAAQLITDHPALAARMPSGDAGKDGTRATALLAAGKILPILDGLDEIPDDEMRASAITAISEALQPGTQLVLTCRTEEYRHAVRPRHGIEATWGAAAIELRPLAAATVIKYWRADADVSQTAAARWRPVTAVLGTQAPAGLALTTPLMVGLANAIYTPRPGERASDLREPAELCNPALANQGAVERHLLGAYISAAFRCPPGTRPRWKAEDAERWLAFMARRLMQNSTDIAWWRLSNGTPQHLVGVTLGVLAGLASAAGYPFIGWGLGPIFGLGAGLIVQKHISTAKVSITQGLFGGMLGGTIAAVLALAILGPGVRNYNISGLVAAGLAIGVAVASLRKFAASLVAGFVGSITAGFYEHAPIFYAARTAVGPWLHLINAIGFGLTALAFVALADQDKDKDKPARRLHVSIPWLALGIACGTVIGLGVWVQTGWIPGVSAGLATATAGVLLGGMGEAIPTDLESPADPREILRQDRIAFLTAWLGLGLAFGLSTALTLAVSPNLSGQPNGIRAGVLVGLANLVVVGLTFGCIQATWGSFTVARCWLAASRQLPWRYMAFLHDAHARGVLRQAGAVYQFRHNELQKWLAPSTDRKMLNEQPSVAHDVDLARE